MMTRFEGTFRGFEDAELFYQAWTTPEARGTIVLTHGLAEHSECYHALAVKLNGDHWNVFGWDLRGHGRSEGKRGYVEDFGFFMKDLGAFVQFVRTQKHLPAPGPIALFGHSLGGQIVTRAVLDANVENIAAALLSAPAFGLTMTVPAWKITVAETAIKWLPSMTLANSISWRDLTRDEAQIKLYDQDPLRHGRISPALFLGMRAGFDEVAARASEFRLPLCVQYGGRDPMIDGTRAKSFFEHVSSTRKQICVYPESLHEIYNDLDRDQAFNDLKKFLGKV